MEFISAQEIADRWGISKQKAQMLCATNRIDNAVRIGNVWVVPNTAIKPEDPWYKRNPTNKNQKRINPIKIARTKIKVLSENAFKVFISLGFSVDEAKTATIAIFATELLYHCCNSNKKVEPDIHREARSAISSLMHLEIRVPEIIERKLSDGFQQFIYDNLFCFDDALAWCYQYVSKMSNNSMHTSTQFFTEKYMITALVNSTDIVASDGKILDPACGGGNFLLHCFDILADAQITPSNDSTRTDIEVQKILDRLYGYDIDPSLAIVASINLRLKVLSALSSHGFSVRIKDFLRIRPNIFCSAKESKWGALDYDKANHLVVRIGSIISNTMEEIFRDTNFLFTNPPFRTVKGMPNDLKDYLKKYYPNSKCDMCNAFIELSTKILNPMGYGGLVTQNSWMYLDSFVAFRKHLVAFYSIESIIELGSNAFYDLNGEKANVALLLFRKTQPTEDAKVSLFPLRNLSQVEIEQILSSYASINIYRNVVSQSEIMSTSSVRFDMFSSQHLKKILENNKAYGNFAIPMQGTSTGDAKTLVDYYWNHIDESDWLPVSKGGGYSRWQGLNCYCVKWGKNGEYIKAKRGAAIRNAAYFEETQLVFSDTGTSGLNVRILLPGQLFIASGPGIRLLRGDLYSHIAFLNSRFASYYIRLLSPKLTIAAGYIAKLPIDEELLSSPTLSLNSKKCVTAKKRRLEKRPCNIEFCLPQVDFSFRTLTDCAYKWFIEDLSDEWTQLCCEQAIEDEISKAFALNDEDISVMESQIGTKLVYAKNNENVCKNDIKENLQNLLDSNCLISRTRVNKVSLGCDGMIEYISQKLGCSCEAVYKNLTQTDIFFSELKESYIGLLLHAITMSSLGLGYSDRKASTSIETLASKITILYPNIANELNSIMAWLRNSFSRIHTNAFMNKPIYTYNRATDSIELLSDKAI